MYDKNIFAYEKEKIDAFNIIIKHFEEKKVAHDIKEFSDLNLAKLIYIMRGASGRYISDLLLANKNKHTQMHGRDIKRWAADRLGILDDAAADWAN